MCLCLCPKKKYNFCGYHRLLLPKPIITVRFFSTPENLLVFYIEHTEHEKACSRNGV